MTYTVVVASGKSNLFKEWDALAAIPWMTATVKDFYQNLFLIWLWVLYKEGSVWKAVLWGLGMAALGSILTPIYVFIQLKKIGPNEPVGRAFVRA
jgi:hypothetical protein